MNDETRQAIEAALQKYADAVARATSTEACAMLGGELAFDIGSVLRAVDGRPVRTITEVVDDAFLQLREAILS